MEDLWQFGTSIYVTGASLKQKNLLILGENKIFAFIEA
jgi:hypothetical protein